MHACVTLCVCVPSKNIGEESQRGDLLVERGRGCCYVMLRVCDGEGICVCCCYLCVLLLSHDTIPLCLVAIACHHSSHESCAFVDHYLPGAFLGCWIAGVKSQAWVTCSFQQDPYLVCRGALRQLPQKYLLCLSNCSLPPSQQCFSEDTFRE